MKPNPGGQLDPEEVLGRDELIADIWDILAGRNVYMNDLRRIGKTMILNKMVANPASGWVVLKRDLGGLRSGGEFATQVYRDAFGLLNKRQKALRRMEKIIDSGVEFSGILKLKDGSPVPWKDTLTRTIADLDEVFRGSDDKLVFFWDEVPFLLDNIRVDEGPERAMEILDTLRSLSQDYPNVRFLLTGSVGIHHVLSELRKVGYNNSPLNTFERVAPGPLAHSEAVSLSRQLLEGAGLDVGNDTAAAETIASLAGDVPYYIHRLISAFPKGNAITDDALHGLLERELLDADSDWDLGHYRNRLDKYYPSGNDAKIALAILDSLAAASSSKPFSELANEVRSSIAETDDEQIRALLKRLLKDHYLTRDENGKFSFRLDLVRRWWKLDRCL